jgi:citronellol/citronellal dehydrogenase
LNLSPPLNMKTKWFESHVAYTMAKFGMSMCTLGMAGEFAGKIAVNSLWPRSVIATSAVQNLLGGDEVMKQSRTPEIMADAAWAIITKDFRSHTGHFLIDDDVLKAEGVTDLSKYQAVPGVEPLPDFFIEPEDFGGWKKGAS